MPKIDDLCLALKEKFDTQSKSIDRLNEENKKLKSEYYKDEQMKEMKWEVDAAKASLRRGFPISIDEDTAIKDWMDEHEKVHKGGHGVSGGKYSYIFIPTSIGTIGKIRCSCGAEFTFQEI